jgi:hypothetical protein
MDTRYGAGQHHEPNQTQAKPNLSTKFSGMQAEAVENFAHTGGVFSRQIPKTIFISKASPRLWQSNYGMHLRHLCRVHFAARDCPLMRASWSRERLRQFIRNDWF